MEQFRSHAVTHPGTTRGHNEDIFVARPDLGLWAVADGAGGHAEGKVASEAIASTLEAIPSSLTAAAMLAQVRMRIDATNAALWERAAHKGVGELIASTVVVLIVSHGHYACLWAGDSRAYLLRQNRLQRITRDHSLVQELIDAGDLEVFDAGEHPRANIITRAVGASADGVELDEVTGCLAVGDRFLLCTDGLSKVLEDMTISHLLATGPAELAAENLISEALARCAGDNVTALVMEVVGSEYG
jgi:protein phosphatase/serine/threonine-protein phosphatase Stp1